MTDAGYFKPRGCAFDLGCGRGGWSQHMATFDQVTSVKGGRVRGGTGHERPTPFETRGFDLCKLKENTDAYAMPPEKCDTFTCDIGETDPDPNVEEGRTLRNLKLAEEWLRLNPKAAFYLKLVNPFGMRTITKMESLQRQFGGGLVRCPSSRNSTSEMYWSSETTGNIRRVVRWLETILLRRMVDEPKTSYHGSGPTLTRGTRCATSLVRPTLNENQTGTRVHHVKNMFRNTWHQDPDAPYRHWQYFGSYIIKQIAGGGSTVNGVINYAFCPWQEREAVLRYQMTNVSSGKIQSLFSDKVDTIVEPRPLGTKTISRTISN